eukprot:6205309-Pleurochrysis_carterae.AAC.3
MAASVAMAPAYEAAAGHAAGGASPASDMYSEAESVIAHMVTVFSEKADTLAIRSARHCIDEIAALSAARHEEMRNSLKGALRH